MNNKIIVLDEVLASKIAAGEVIERPASAVKELIENSIDAGAKRIDVEVHSGGKALIRVTDDGCGMNEIEALTSFERHATSKIKNIDDLFSISSLGFRGEALPSIASVSKLEMITNDGEKGTFISIEGGRIIESKEFACPKGTSIIVKELFFNTPVRQKFMRADNTEMSHIADIVSKFIVCYPDISFSLSSNGRTILSSRGEGNLLNSIASVYGADFSRNLLEFKSKKFEGFIGKPQETKINREGELFFVNKRIVRNHLLSKAFEDAYLNLIPRDRKPQAIIFIKIDPKEIDVNIHPAKREIRLLKPNEIMSELTRGVREALNKLAPNDLVSSQRLGYGVRVNGYGEWDTGNGGQGTGNRELGTRDREPYNQTAQEFLNQNPEILSSDLALRLPVCDSESSAPFPLPPSPLTLTPYPLSLTPCPLPIAQLALTYIICLDNSGLILIDQHAAHERILYEKIKANNSSIISSQQCLIEEIIELSNKDFAVIEENLIFLKEIGFEAEIFGRNEIRVKAVPFEAEWINIKKLVGDIILELAESKASLSLENIKEKINKLVACHAAVKSGDKLNLDEMKNLVKELFLIANPSTCPHGRPSIVKLGIKDISKFFNR